jgi:cytochrome P450
VNAVTPQSFAYDPFSPVVQDDPYPFYKVLRDEHPVYRTPGRDFWTLSRFTDVQSAARDHGWLSNARGVELDDAAEVYPGAFGPGIVGWTDPPDHGRIRKVVQRSFSPAGVAALEPMVRGHVNSLLDELEASESPDLARDFAWRLPLLTTSDILGFPLSDHAMILEWMLALEARDPEADLYEMSEAARTAATEIAAYIRAGLEDRRDTPRDDLLTLFMAAEQAGHLREGESRGLTFIFFVAGIDTTACLIGNMLHRLAPRPGDRARLVAAPDRYPALVEEIVRYEAPVQGLARWTTREASLHGVTIPEGVWVWLAFAAANRDDRVFANPDELDVDRPKGRHLGFGEGIHHCIGAPLARLEGRLAAEELFRRFPGYAITGPGRRLHQHTTRGWVNLPAALRP